MKQKHMTQETVTQNIKSQLQKGDELKKIAMYGQFYWDLENPSVDLKNPWHGYVAQD